MSGMLPKLREFVGRVARDEWMKWVVLAFFVVYLALGCVLFKDYGVSTDEIYQIDKARITLDYVFGRTDALLTYPDRHYGAIFPILLDLGGSFFSDSRDIFLYRHFITFLFFYLSTIVFYKLLRKLGYNRLLSLTGTVLLILHPHIFGHSFYNPKDIPFLGMWVLAMYTLAGLIQDKATTKSLVLHGLVTGLLIVFRLPGVLMWGVTGLMLVWLWFSGQIKIWQVITKFLATLSISLLTLYLFLPILWADPIKEFVAFVSMSPFEWTGKELFMGQFYTLDQLPWYHLPVYFAVTMPLVLLALFGVGMLLGLWQLLWKKGAWQAASGSQVLSIVATSFSLLVLFIGRPAVYNGWRHVLFVYPMVLLVVLQALQSLWQIALSFKRPWVGQALRGMIVVSLLGQLIVLTAFIVDSHPYEYTYYNMLTGRKLAGTRFNYIMDYWGISFLRAFERILEKDPSPLIVVSTDNILSARQNWLMLTAEQRARIKLVDVEADEPEDYFISTFREFLPLERKSQRAVDTIYVRGAAINITYQRRNK